MTVEDDATAVAVADTLTEAARAVSDSTPSWPRIEQGLRRVRRRRRLRTALRAGVGAAAVVGLVTGIQGGVLPYPAWAPAVVLPASGHRSALYDGPTRGSLAGDAAFLADLRRRAADWRSDASDGQAWRVASAADVHVVFAGDVGEQRLALVETPVRWGALEDQRQIWFQGPIGAQAGALTFGGIQAASDVAVHAAVPAAGVPADGDPADGGQASLVVLAPDTRTVEVARSPIVRADGTLTWDTAALTAQEPGTWTAQVPIGYALVRVSGEGGWRRLDVARSSFGDRPATLDHPLHDVLAPFSARGTALDVRDRVWMALEEWVPGGGEVALWSGTLEGWDVAVTAQRSPSVVPGPSRSTADDERGWFVALGASRELGPAPEGTTSDGTTATVSTSTQGVIGRPAGAVEDIAVALRLPDPRLLKQGDPGWDTVRPSRSVALLAPARATTARVSDAAGRVTTVPLNDGVAVAAVVDATRVTFLDAGGRSLAATDVVVVGFGSDELNPPS